MRPFKVYFTGDLLNEDGNIRGHDIGIKRLRSAPFMETAFLVDQKPAPGDSSYWDRLYSLDISAEDVEKANALVVVRPWLKADAFRRGANNLIAVVRAGAGYDKIDLEACTRNDVVVCNTPDSLTHSTASAALTLMLALAKKLPQQQALVANSCWESQSNVYGDDLIGKTLGIIGFGKTGQELARLVAPFHMHVITYSPRADRFAAQAMGVSLAPDLNTLLRASDFVSLHCRLEEHTKHLLDASRLKLLKPTAYLINVARGEMVDEEALIEHLREHRIAGAGLDVFETEPLPASSGLHALDNAILTPHWLPSTNRAAEATTDAICSNLLLLATGSRPQNVLNPPVLTQSGFLRKLAQFEENRQNC